MDISGLRIWILIIFMTSLPEFNCDYKTTLEQQVS